MDSHPSGRNGYEYEGGDDESDAKKAIITYRVEEDYPSLPEITLRSAPAVLGETSLDSPSAEAEAARQRRLPTGQGQAWHYIDWTKRMHAVAMVTDAIDKQGECSIQSTRLGAGLAAST